MQTIHLRVNLRAAHSSVLSGQPALDPWAQFVDKVVTPQQIVTFNSPDTRLKALIKQLIFPPTAGRNVLGRLC